MIKPAQLYKEEIKKEIYRDLVQRRIYVLFWLVWS